MRPSLADTRAALSHAGLDLQGAPHRIDGAGELGQKPISGVLEYPAVVGLDAGIEQLAANAIEPIKRALFVCTDQPTETSYIRCQYRRELPVRTLGWHGSSGEDHSSLFVE